MVNMLSSSSSGSFARKPNNKIDFPKRKKNNFSKKNGRTNTFSSEKAKRHYNKQKDLKKLSRARETKLHVNTPYSRVRIRNGRQMYDKFDNEDDYVRQYWDKQEFSKHRAYLNDLYDFWDYIDSIEMSQQEFEEEKQRIEVERRYIEEEEEMKLKKNKKKNNIKKKIVIKKNTCSGCCNIHCPQDKEENITDTDDYIYNWFD